MKNKSLSNIFKGDKVIWMVFFFLCIISIVEVYSASSSLSFTKGNYWSPIIYHCSILIVGIVLMVFVLNIKCRYFKLITPIVLIVSTLMLIWVLVAGQTTNGANRWITLAGLQFQPSEQPKVHWSQRLHRCLVPCKQITEQTVKPSNTSCYSQVVSFF